MKKTLKKVLSVFLAMTLLVFVPVIASAADDNFDFSSVSIKAISGNWNDDYVGRVCITLEGSGRKLAGDGVILTVGTNENADNIRSVSLSDAKVSFSGSNTKIEFDLNMKLNHGTVYSFLIREGAFLTSINDKNNSYKLSVSGNIIIESLDKESLPDNPIDRLIITLENSKYKILLYPLILMLKFFVSL